ncbi:MAG TPA: bifunctional DNA primase/polymerase, partial [Thermoanaerobaculia bacterium]|nr:bifunctional DNA primase/polymerase [Thermoanaerobaculia bacterium]
MLLNAALSHAARGWRVLPLWWPTPAGCACGNNPCSNAAKHPIGELVPHGCHDATTDPAVIESWWTRFPEANVG